MSDQIKSWRTQLEQAAAELDPTAIAWLRAARLRAVAAAEARRPSRFRAWLPLTGAVAASVIAVAATVTWWRGPDPFAPTVAADEVEWLLAKESPDFFGEQLEFYHWLGEQHDAS